MSAKYEKLRLWLYHETWALPVDIFRVLVGILCLFYFSSLIREVDDFSSREGLINHAWYLKNFWWLNINLIQPAVGMASTFYMLLGGACIGTLGIIIGYRPRLVAFILFLIATCIQRWNFAVMYVDDGVMHLLLFWLVLLPVGKTLILSEWLKEGNSCFVRWCQVKVPGLAVSCLIGNICWIYFFAGVTKLTSPLWQEGVALYAILKVPISRLPDFWMPEHLPFLKFTNYAAMVMEIALPFLLLSPKWSLRKWIGLLLQISFNLGIVLTLRIPFANIALLASPVLFFREELMEAISRRYKLSEELGHIRRIGLPSIIAIIFVILVCMSTWRRVPTLKHIGQPATKALWAVGVAQDYRLFDWIDRMNYHLNHEVIFYPASNPTPKKVELERIFPGTVRHSLVQARIYDVYWLFPIPNRLKNELEKDTRHRFEDRACGIMERDGILVIKTHIHRITSDNIRLTKRPRTELISFLCSGGEVVQ